jgi:hypothetical protein
LGGIALIGIVGSGTWEYSSDSGTTYHAINGIGPSSALLLSKETLFRYTPDNKNGEIAKLVYRAWDATIGVVGSKVDLSAAGAVGGVTPYSDATDTASLSVSSVNDAPTLTAAASNPIMGKTTNNTAIVVGLADSFINKGTGTTVIADVDTNATIGGIALVGITGNGLWEYSLDGTTFHTIASASDAAALLLPRSASLRYTPSLTDNSVLATIAYRAWDTTTGSIGQIVDISASGAVGGTTAFSAVKDTAKVIVNNAPVLTAGNPSLPTTNENSFKDYALSSFINQGSGTTTITDSDAGSVIGGIALVGVFGNGSWSYSLNGTSFTAIDKAILGAANAILLSKTAILRYTPDNKNGETTTITYRAWDTSVGTAGGTVDLTGENATGGATAYSAAVDTATLIISSVNDAPSLTGAQPSLGSTTPSNPKTILLNGTFLNNGTNTTKIEDVDTGAVVGGIAIFGITGDGAWEYSLDGTTFQSIGTVSASSSLLVAKDSSLRFTPTGTNSQMATIRYYAWDATSGVNGSKVDLSASGATGGSTAFSSASDTASLLVNNSPILTPIAPKLGVIHDTTPKVIALNSFINNIQGSPNITDSNGNAVVGGIAITGFTGAGTWSYSLDGTTYSKIVSASNTSALLLSPTSFLRYTSDGTTGEEATVIFRAWDTTRGVNGQQLDLTVANPLDDPNASSISSTSDTASILAQFTTLSNSVIKDNLAIGSEVGTLHTTPETGYTYTYSLDSSISSTDNSSFVIVGNVLKTKTTFNAGLKNSYNVAISTKDQLGNSYSKTFTISLTDVTAPTVTINQQVGQADPTTSSSVYYLVVFSEPVTGFTVGDVVLSGTAPGATVKKVLGSGTTYEVQVSGMTGSGNVIASIPAGKATDNAGNTSLASTSTDNTIQIQKNTVSYSGTGKNDVFVFSPGAAAGAWQLSVNGIVWAIPSTAEGILINGAGGSDSIRFVGTSGNDSAEFWSDHALFHTAGFDVKTSGISYYAFDGGAGGDSAIVHDRAGVADVFSCGPGWGVMNGASVSLGSIENCTIAATSGDHDSIIMYGAANSSKANSFTASSTSATMTMPGYVNTATNFADVQAYVAPGSGGNATFTDSSGDDLFLLSPIGADQRAKNGSYEVSAWGFANVTATASQGGTNDEIRFYGKSGATDTFVVSPTSATYTNAAFVNKSSGYDDVQAYIDPNNNSTATLTGSSDTERLVTSPLGAQLFGTSFQSSAWNFKHIIAQSVGGNDTADMYGSTAADSFVGRPTSASFSGAAFDRQALNFSKVTAHGKAEDSAIFYDTASLPMSFVGKPTESTASGTGFNNIAQSFGNVQAYATAGNSSTATFLDSTGADYYTGSALGASMVGSGYNNSAWNFKTTSATSTGGHDVAYLFARSTGSNELLADSVSAACSGDNGSSNTASGFELVNVYGANGSDKATLDNVLLLESGLTSRPLDGSPYNHKLVLNMFDSLYTTETPTSTTPVQKAVDQVMSAYWP